jgi:hypothetical protein
MKSAAMACRSSASLPSSLQAYVFGPPPVSDTAMALTALGLYFGFAAIIYWLEGKRS